MHFFKTLALRTGLFGLTAHSRAFLAAAFAIRAKRRTERLHCKITVKIEAKKKGSQYSAMLRQSFVLRVWRLLQSAGIIPRTFCVRDKARHGTRTFPPHRGEVRSFFFSSRFHNINATRNKFCLVLLVAVEGITFLM